MKQLRILFLLLCATQALAQSTTLKLYRVGDQVVTETSSQTISYPSTAITVRAQGTSIYTLLNGSQLYYSSAAQFQDQNGMPYGSTVTSAVNAYLGTIPAISGGGSGGTTTTNASQLISGTLSDDRLSTNVVKQADFISGLAGKAPASIVTTVAATQTAVAGLQTTKLNAADTAGVNGFARKNVVAAIKNRSDSTYNAYKNSISYDDTYFLRPVSSTATAGDAKLYQLPDGRVYSVGINYVRKVQFAADSFPINAIPSTPVVEDVRFVQPTPANITTSGSGTGDVNNSGSGTGSVTSIKKLGTTEGSYFRLPVPNVNLVNIIIAIPQTSNAAIVIGGDKSANLYSNQSTVGLGVIANKFLEFKREGNSLVLRIADNAAGLSSAAPVFTGINFLTAGAVAKLIVDYPNPPGSNTDVQPITGYALEL